TRSRADLHLYLPDRPLVRSVEKTMPRSGRCQIAESAGSEPLHQDMFPEQRRGSVPRGKLARLLIIKPEMSAPRLCPPRMNSLRLFETGRHTSLRVFLD